MEPRRILFFDVFQSIAIGGMLIFHSVLWFIFIYIHLLIMILCNRDYKFTKTEYILPEDENSPETHVQVIFFLLTNGGIFHVISGVLFSYLSSIRLQKSQRTREQLFLYCNLQFGLYVLLHFFVNLITSHVGGWLFFYLSPNHSTSQLDFELILQEIRSMCTLYITAFNYFLFAPLVFIVFSKSITRNVGIVLTLFVAILLATQHVTFGTFKVAEYLIKEGNLFAGIVLSPLFFDYFPIFPHFAYFLLGVAFGLLLANDNKAAAAAKVKTKKKTVKLKFSLTKPAAILLPITGVFAYVGVKYFAKHYDYTLYTSLYEERSQRGYEFRIHLKYVQLFLTVLVLLIGLYVVDVKYRARYSSLTRWKWIPAVKLTSYTFEALLKALFFRLWDVLVPAWDESLGAVLLFGLFNVVAWVLISMAWKKVNNYKFSVEYCFRRIVKLL